MNHPNPTFPLAPKSPSPYVTLYITRNQAEAVLAVLEGRSARRRILDAAAKRFREVLA